MTDTRRDPSRSSRPLAARRSMQIAAAALLALAANAALSLPASATSFCTVKRTSDGFGALRAGPGANARMILRMRAGDEVMLGLNERGPWYEVTFWRQGVRHTDGGFGRGRPGWVHRSLLGECG